MYEQIARFALVAVLALVFGLVRQRLGKPIGFGTFIFVASGACGLAITALNFGRDNPLPLLSGIVTGIGFLGAGALIRNGDRIHGFTSAATIWSFAVFGLSAGVGELPVAALIYGINWVVMLGEQVLERRALGAYRKTLTVTVSGVVDEAALCDRLGLVDPLIEAAEVDRQGAPGPEGEGPTSTYEFGISGTSETLRELRTRLRDDELIRRFRLE